MKDNNILKRRYHWKSAFRVHCWLVCLLTVLLTACSNGASTSSSTPNSTSEKQTHIIKHAMGETEVPIHPKRVVVLDTGELDAALTLGITPVGAVSALQDGPFLNYFGNDRLKGITSVGTIAQPNIEKILSLNPDLILSNKARHANIYKQLSEIAPTIFAKDVGVTWKENFFLYADALGKKQEGQQLLQRYYARLKEFKQQMGDRLQKTSISIVRVMPTQFRLYVPRSYIGVILQDAGLPRPAPQNVDAQTFVTMTSYEKIPDMDGDIIFLMQYGKSNEKLQDLQLQPQWKQLKAVKGDKVFVVNDDYWATGIGMTSANLVVEDLFKYVAK